MNTETVTWKRRHKRKAQQSMKKLQYNMQYIAKQETL